MKNTLFLLLICSGASIASAGTVTEDIYSFPGSGTPISLGGDILGELVDGGQSFAISYELQGLSLNDIVLSGGTFFEVKLDNKTLSVGYNAYLGFYLCC